MMQVAVKSIKIIIVVFAICASGCAAISTEQSANDDWALRHPMPEGMKSLIELRAADAVKVCRQKLIGKDHQTVRMFLGTSERDHGEDEYIYYPTRADGSFWILIVEFDGSGRAVDISGQELWPPDTKKK
jgi:hypothetical protein